MKRPDLKGYFQQQSAERGRFAQELERELSSLGKQDKRPSGSVAGALHRTWIDAKANLGGGDKTILESVEQGEDNAKKAYQEALSGQLSPNLQTLVQRQAESVKSAHDKVKSMRDSLAA